MSDRVLKLTAVLMMFLLLPLSSVTSADTWQLRQGQDWKKLSDSDTDNYLLAVAEIKRLVFAGETTAVTKAIKQLKLDFPEIASDDFDAFTKAEILFCKGKFAKASGSYEKFLDNYPQSKLYQAALDRNFAIAKAFLAGRKKKVLGIFRLKGYAEGEKIMDNISDRTGSSPVAGKAVIAVAKSCQERNKFSEAYYKWSEISSRWPTGQTGKEALFYMAGCKHAAYEGPAYDSACLLSAKSYYQKCRLIYPDEAKKLKLDNKIQQINEQMAYKQFTIGSYYQRTGDRQAANLYYQMVIDNWPNTTAGKMAQAAMADKKSGSEKEKKWESILKKFEKILL